MQKLALALAVSGASAFVPAAAPKVATKLDASITETLSTLEGPEIFWGSDGVLEGYDESDIKGYDNFDVLAGAMASEGVELGAGPWRAARKSSASGARREASSSGAVGARNAAVGRPSAS